MRNSETQDDSLVWHYTSGAGLRGIIESNALRASSAAFMNDANEMRTGVRALRAAYERIKSTLNEAERQEVERGSFLRESAVDSWFLVSGSQERDLLTLWRAYGAGTSYAIGFDRTIRLAPIEHRIGEEHPSPPPGFYEDSYEEIDGRNERLYDPDYVGVMGGSWRNVTYVSPTGFASHEEQVREFATRSARQERESKGFLFDLGVFADSDVNYEKDGAFEDEREARLIVELSPAWKFVQYRDSRFGLVPYVELGIGSIEGRRGRYVPHNQRGPLPIREVMVGPGPIDPVASERALRGLLDNRGYGGVVVSRSEIPFR